MEHEQIIQDKIRKLEENPAHWNQEQVWQSISIQPAAKRYGSIAWYAAASFIVIALVLFSLLYKMNSNARQLKITTLELAIERKMNQKIAKQQTVSETIACTENKATEVIRQDVFTKRTLPVAERTYTQPDIALLPTLEDTLKAAVAYNAIAITSAPVEQIKAAKPDKVKPIFGPVSQSIPTYAVKDKKMKFLLFPIETLDKEDTESKQIFAKIN